MPSSDSSVPAQCSAPMRSLPVIVDKSVITIGVADTSSAPLATLVLREPADEQVLIQAVPDEAEPARRIQSRAGHGRGRVEDAGDDGHAGADVGGPRVHAARQAAGRRP